MVSSWQHFSIRVTRRLASCLACVSLSVHAVCPVTSVSGCGTCPSTISDTFSATEKVQIVGSNQYRCTIAGLAALTQAGCIEGQCAKVVNVDVPFAYSDCETSQGDACMAWKWLHCAFPDDLTSGNVMHGYFFVDGKFEGIGFKFAEKDVAGLLNSAGASTVDDGCGIKFPDAAKVVAATMKDGEAKGLVLFGWDGCPCTGIAHNRFSSATLCYEELTWADPYSEVMKYLQCKEGDPNHHSFVYFRNGQDWKFHGTGFDFDANTVSNTALMQMASQANVKSHCANEFAVNLYGESLSECRAAATDQSGSWMWDGKCTEKGGGVHQICMDKLPADFSVTTGQGPWSEGRADRRHCVCIGAWSLYMTREEDPQWQTSIASPFCDAIPLSALTSRYIGNWKDWNGIPAEIVQGAVKLLTKCLKHRSGPGSQAPPLQGACHLAKAFKELQSHESSLSAIAVDTLVRDAGFDCTGVKVPELGEMMHNEGHGGSGGGAMQKTNTARSSESKGGASSSSAGSQADAPKPANSSNSLGLASGALHLGALLPIMAAIMYTIAD